MNFTALFEKYQRACIAGYCLRCVYGLYLVLRSKNTKASSALHQTLRAKLKEIFFTFNHYQFAGGIATATATYALLTHFLLHHKHNANQNAPSTTRPTSKTREVRVKLVAICIAVSWFRYLPKQFREMIVLHLFVRAVYDLIKVYKYDEQLSVLPHIPHDEAFVGAAALTVIGYGIYHNPWVFDQGFYQFILKWGSNTHEQIGNVFRSKKDPLSPVRLPGEAFVECVPEWHSDPSCFRFHVKNIGRDFLRSNGMYAFVHLAPLLIAPKFWRLCYRATRSLFVVHGKNAADGEEEEERVKLMRLLRRKLFAIARSSLFFVCFQHFSKLIQCYWRHYVLRADPIWSTVACVYIATVLAECFETPQRRIQYTLYTSTQIIRMIGNAMQLRYGAQMKGNKYVQWFHQNWSVVFLQLTFMIWCYIKAIGRDQKYCGQWSLKAIDLIMPDID